MTLAMYWQSLFLLLIQSLGLTLMTWEMFGFWVFFFFIIIILILVLFKQSWTIPIVFRAVMPSSSDKY